MFNVLLQVLDDGRLTDGQGRTVNFKDTVLIMTSNVGSQFVAAAVGQDGDASYERGQGAGHGRAAGHVPAGVPQPHRRGDRLPRASRTRTSSASWTCSLADLVGRLAERDITLELTPAARALIAREGHDPQFGARPLKRAVQRLVENPLARGLLEGRFMPGATVTVDADPIGGTLLCSGPDGDARWWASQAAGATPARPASRWAPACGPASWTCPTADPAASRVGPNGSVSTERRSAVSGPSLDQALGADVGRRRPALG